MDAMGGGGIGDLLSGGGGSGGGFPGGDTGGGFPGSGAFPGDTGGFPGGDPSQPGFTPDTGFPGGGGFPGDMGGFPFAGNTGDPSITAPAAMNQGTQGGPQGTASSPGSGTQSGTSGGSQGPSSRAQQPQPQQQQSSPLGDIQQIADLLLGKQQQGLGFPQLAEANTGTMTDAGPIMIPPNAGTSGPPNVVTGPSFGGEARPPMGGGPQAGTGAMPQPQPPGQGGGPQASTGDLPQPDTSGAGDVPLPRPRPAEAPAATKPEETTTAGTDTTDPAKPGATSQTSGGQQPFNPLQNFAQAIAKFLHGDFAGGLQSLLGLSQQAQPWMNKPPAPASWGTAPTGPQDPRWGKAPGAPGGVGPETAPKTAAPVSPQSTPAPGGKKDPDEAGISEAEKQSRIRARDLPPGGTFAPNNKGQMVPAQLDADGRVKVDAEGNPVPPAAAQTGGAGAPIGRATPDMVNQQSVSRSRLAGTDTRPTAGYSNYLRQQRSRFATEMQNPQRRLEVMAMMNAENSSDPIGPVESLMNRAAMTNKSLHDRMFFRDRRGHTFYGPINTGKFNQHLIAVRNSPALQAKYGRYIDAALSGSNVLGGATDQGSLALGDPNARNPSGRVIRSNEVYNDWGYKGAANWRREQQRHVQEELRGGPSAGGTGPRSEIAPNTQMAMSTPEEGRGRGPQLAGGKPPTNDNRNLQIPDDPYTQSIIDQQWRGMVKEGNKPPLKVIPGGKTGGLPQQLAMRGDVMSDAPTPGSGSPDIALPEIKVKPPNKDAAPAAAGLPPPKKTYAGKDQPPKKGAPKKDTKKKPKGMDPGLKKRIQARQQRDRQSYIIPSTPAGMGRMFTTYTPPD